MLETLFKVGCLISTPRVLISVIAREPTIRYLQSTTTSSIELLQLVEPFVRPEIKQKMHAFLVLSRLSSIELITDDELLGVSLTLLHRRLNRVTQLPF